MLRFEEKGEESLHSLEETASPKAWKPQVPALSLPDPREELLGCRALRSTNLLSEASQEDRLHPRTTLTVWVGQASMQGRGLSLYQMHPADWGQWLTVASA